MTERYWFSRKRVGWGWGLPTMWQGWLVLVTYLVGLFMLGRWLPPSSSLPMFLLCVFGWSAALLAVYWRKGEPLSGKWGE